jgi:dTMP kinase
VLSDRYADATVAYQGAGRGFEPWLINDLVDLATGGLKPDLTLLFDLPVADARARAVQRARHGRGDDRLEAEDAAFHGRVRDCYLQIAAREPQRVRVVGAASSVEEVHARVLQIVLPFLEERGQRLEAGGRRPEPEAQTP